jgi:hypothetical protein
MTTTHVPTALVSEVDNQGEDCHHCEEIGAVVAVNLYWVDFATGRDGIESCCLGCARTLSRRLSDDGKVATLAEIPSALEV